MGNLHSQSASSDGRLAGRSEQASHFRAHVDAVALDSPSQASNADQAHPMLSHGSSRMGPGS
eukprot:CAMPEP_0202841098 /NCGR_PEP_ID=MMETSP1389-20130828/57528_1 /ASSEMBLY_ACC=CAM_ASM_000865 /TAXON_ID=302021 /ORGANISM="Rhodomonas sp., Strain CCMP768" /LENGTH=61 /DNA_ID=CAMNT_0049517857 /DNA_START=31 /DNA_END=216 /DNA_ORIENTATION=-